MPFYLNLHQFVKKMNKKIISLFKVLKLLELGIDSSEKERYKDFEVILKKGVHLVSY